MRKILTLLILVSGLNMYAEVLPEWLNPLRDAFYRQTINIAEAEILYNNAISGALRDLSGISLDLALSRCEYFIGRILQDAELNDEARVHYLEGMRLAENVTKTNPGSIAWQLFADNLSQVCSLGPWTYAMANGLNVEKYAKNALDYDSRNAGAQYLLAARWVYAPAPFANLRRGIQMMEAILTEANVDRYDQFNVYSSIGYAYIQQRRPNDARPWLLRAQEIFPTNKHIAELLNTR